MGFAFGPQSAQIPKGVKFEAIKKKKDPFGPNILHNLAADIEETVLGLPAAIGAIASTSYGDVKHIFGGGKQDEFRMDNLVGSIAKTTVQDLKYRWSPLAKGDFGTWWDRAEEAPLATILDIATIATGGGAALGKAGKAAAAGGKEGMLTKAAGLSRSERTLGDVMAGRQVLDVNKRFGAKEYESFARRDVAELGGVVEESALAGIWDGPSAKLMTGDGEVEIPLAHNPATRARQKALVKLGNKYTNAPLIGANVRGSRKVAKRIDSRVVRDSTTMTMVADRMYKGLDEGDQRTATMIDFAHQPAARADFDQYYQRRLENIDEDMAGASETDGTAAKLQAARERVEERLAAIRDDATWEHATNPEAWSPQLKEFMAATEKTAEATTRMQWELSGRNYRGRPVEFQDYLDIQRTRQARQVTDSELEDLLDDDEITPADLAAAMRAEGISPHAYVRPHYAQFEAAKHRSVGPSVSFGGLSQPKNKRGNRNTGVLFADAMDMLSPQAVTLAAKDTLNFKGQLAKFDYLLESGRTVATEAAVPKGWVRIEPDRVGAQLDSIEAWMTSEARVVFGDQPELAEVRDRFTRLREAMGNGGLAVPKAMADELITEVHKANKFIDKYDDLTALWRHATLTARPVWATSNIVGATSLLMLSHGMIRGTVGLFDAIKRGNKGALLDQIAPDVTGQGFMKSALEELRNGPMNNSLVGTKAEFLQGTVDATRGMADYMLRLNSYLSDDIPRRAAFEAEIRPHVKRIVRETGMSYEDAALSWLSDPKVVDSIAERVLGDLISFRDLTKFERKYLRRLMPFWSFVRGSTGRTWRLAADEPHKAWLGFNATAWAVEENEDEFGALPSFLKGMVGIGDPKDGKVQMIQTNSLNPLGATADIAGQLQSTLLGSTDVGGANPASSLNPFLKSLAESISGKDLFYGRDIDPENNRSYGERFARQTINSIPQVRLGQKIAGTFGPDPEYQPLFDNSLMDLLLSYGAVPTKKLNLEEANKRAAEEAALGTTPLI